MSEERMAKTISSVDFMEKFPTETSAREYLERLRWQDGVVCPFCSAKDKATPVRGREGYYQCRACRKVYTVRVGTIFHRSRIDLRKWLYAIYLLQTSRKGISSLQLSKEIGITQKSAWFLLKRLGVACIAKGLELKGIIEVYGTYPRNQKAG